MHPEASAEIAESKPRPPSLLDRLGAGLAPVRRRISARHLVLAWATGASVVAAGLALELHNAPTRSPEPAAPAWTSPVRRVRQPTADVAPLLPPGLAGAPPPLVGIVGRLPDNAVALIRTPSGRTQTLEVGALFDGWTLASLDAEEAVFSRRGQRITVTLPLPADQ